MKSKKINLRRKRNVKLNKKNKIEIEGGKKKFQVVSTILKKLCLIYIP